MAKQEKGLGPKLLGLIDEVRGLGLEGEHVGRVLAALERANKQRVGLVEMESAEEYHSKMAFYDEFQQSKTGDAGLENEFLSVLSPGKSGKGIKSGKSGDEDGDRDGAAKDGESMEGVDSGVAGMGIGKVKGGSSTE